jgi:hypothetical protein
MEKLRLRSNQRIERTSLTYQRDELTKIDWTVQLLGIKGARGIGKTTLLLQHIKQTHGFSEKAIYLSLDDIYFTENKLLTLVETFYRNGGMFLYLDEVHKYPNWEIEIKNIYDTYPEIQIIFTGSSMLEIQKSNADLSRRAIVFPLQGLSFRQFLKLKYGFHVEPYTIDSILENANDIIAILNKDFKPYPYFKEYLQTGYYPFFMEGNQWFFDRLEGITKAVIESDFLFLTNIDIKNIRKIYQFLLVVATSPPFSPNIQSLSERTGINRNTLLQYIYYLEKADILTLLQTNRTGITMLQKPEKIYLENSNLLYLFAPTSLDIGMVRETFILNQLKAVAKVHYPDTGGDILVNDTYTFEVGGKSKQKKQIQGLPNSYIIADEWDFKVGNKIPIWLLGLLY